MEYDHLSLLAIAKAIHHLSPKIAEKEILGYSQKLKGFSPEEMLHFMILEGHLSMVQEFVMNGTPHLDHSPQSHAEMDAAQLVFLKAVKDPHKTILAAICRDEEVLKINRVGFLYPDPFKQSPDLTLLHIFGEFPCARARSFIAQTCYGEEYGIKGLVGINQRDMQRLIYKFFVLEA